MSYWTGFNSASDMRTLRRRAGLTQAELGKLAGFSRQAVYHYEGKTGRIDGVAPAAFRAALQAKGIAVPTRGEGPIVLAKMNQNAALAQVCGAKTRNGSPCKCKPLVSGRCKFHGGMSTGPMTKEGRERISLAMKERHRRRRMAKAALPASPPEDRAARIARINRALGL